MRTDGEHFNLKRKNGHQNLTRSLLVEGNPVMSMLSKHNGSSNNNFRLLSKLPTIDVSVNASGNHPRSIQKNLSKIDTYHLTSFHKEDNIKTKKDFDYSIDGDRIGESVSDTLPGIHVGVPTDTDVAKPLYINQVQNNFLPTLTAPLHNQENKAYYHSLLDTPSQSGGEFDSPINRLTDYDILDVDIESLKSMPKQSVAQQKINSLTPNQRTSVENDQKNVMTIISNMVDNYPNENVEDMNNGKGTILCSFQVMQECFRSH